MRPSHVCDCRLSKRCTARRQCWPWAQPSKQKAKWTKLSILINFIAYGTLILHNVCMRRHTLRKIEIPWSMASNGRDWERCERDRLRHKECGKSPTYHVRVCDNFKSDRLTSALGRWMKLIGILPVGCTANCVLWVYSCIFKCPYIRVLCKREASGIFLPTLSHSS